jgi:hypothetical protein
MVRGCIALVGYLGKKIEEEEMKKIKITFF